MSDVKADYLQLGCSIAEAKVVCIFVHGRGQSPEAMREYVIARLQNRDVAYLLPRAPTGSWYDAKAVDPLTAHTRLQMGAALTQIENLVETIPKAKPLLIGGFSQGACLVLEYALKNGAWNGAMVNFTACRVGAKTDARPSASLANFPVYLTGSNVDPWIPVYAWAEAAEALNNAGARLRVETFPGRSHEVSHDEISTLSEMLSALSNGSSIWKT